MAEQKNPISFFSVAFWLAVGLDAWSLFELIVFGGIRVAFGQLTLGPAGFSLMASLSTVFILAVLLYGMRRRHAETQKKIAHGLENAYSVRTRLTGGVGRMLSTEMEKFNHRMRKLASDLRKRGICFEPKPIGEPPTGANEPTNLDRIVAQLERLDESADPWSEPKADVRALLSFCFFPIRWTLRALANRRQPMEKDEDQDENFESLKAAVLEINAKLIAVDAMLAAVVEHAHTERREKVRLLAAVVEALIDVREALLGKDEAAQKALMKATGSVDPEAQVFTDELKRQLDTRQLALLDSMKATGSKESRH